MKRSVKYILFTLLFTLVLALPVLFLQQRGEGESGYYRPEEGILSGYYSIDPSGTYLTGLTPGTTVESLAKVCLPATLSAAQDPVATGTLITATTPTGSFSLTAVVTGDLDRDGSLTARDFTTLEEALAGTALGDAETIAADLDYDGSLTDADLQLLQQALEGEGIRCGAVEAHNRSTMVLMVPQGNEAWRSDAASYRSGNTALVQVSAEGRLTAGEGEGSTFVYALDEAGQVIDRTMVTVLAKHLDITLSLEQATLFPDEALSVSAYLNHPITAAIQWSSTNEAVVTVDASGNITPVAPGTAQVLATLENGNRDAMDITVLSTISSLTLEKTAYKVKPGVTLQLPLTVEPLENDEALTWASSDSAVATVTQDGTVTTHGLGSATISVTSSHSGLSASCEIQVRNIKQVAFTFDDGPTTTNIPLLDFLKENGYKATFFLVCNRIPNFEEVVIREVADGHEIGYHSYSHINQKELTTDRIISDYEKSAKMLKDLTGAEFTLWRTPGGNYNQRVLDAVPLPHIIWSLDPRDWESRDEEKIYRAIMNQAKDGAIILLHDLYPTTIRAAIRAMTDLAAADYEFLTVTELLSRDGTPPQNSTTYFSAFNP